MTSFARTQTAEPVSGSRFISSGMYRLAIMLLAVLYGGVLSSLPLEVFKDRANYLIYTEYSWKLLLSWTEAGLLPALANEPVWLLINAGLAMVLSPEAALRLLIGVPATVVAYQVLRVNPRDFLWLLLVLLVPQVIKNHIVHLRQGVAIAVFLVGWFSARPMLRISLIALTPFIHASFAFVLGFMLLTVIARKLRWAADMRTLLFATAGMATGMALAGLAAVLGARQANDYEFVVTGVSGLGFVFWAGVFLIMRLQGQEFMRRHAFEMGALVFYLSTYFLIEVAARIFESVLILILIAGLRLTDWRRKVFLGAVTFYAGFSYFLRVDAPWLGWGIGQ